LVQINNFIWQDLTDKKNPALNNAGF